jgi:hypothetical protein
MIQVNLEFGELPWLLFLLGLHVLLCCMVEAGPFVIELPAKTKSRCERRQCSFMMTVSSSRKV